MIPRAIKRAVAALLLALIAASAIAQIRPIPADAKRGGIRHLQGMIVEINGSQMNLAPGAQVRDAGNLIVLPTAIPPDSLVKYTLDPAGQIFRVWILSPQEAAQRDNR